MKVLVVDDDDGVRRYVQRVLERAAIHCLCVADADEAEQALEREGAGGFDLVLLDVAMPGRSGTELLEELRRRDDRTPVVILSAHHTVSERVAGLNLGADDFLQKPFQGDELVARIQAVVRRRDSVPVIGIGDLRVDLARRIVERGTELIELSPREFDVLAELAKARGRLVSRRELLDRVWGLKIDPGTKVVEVQVARLRRKLDAGARTSRIQTVVGQGYRLTALSNEDDLGPESLPGGLRSSDGFS